MNFSINALHLHPPVLDFTHALRAELTGSNTASAESITATGNTPVLALCRKLVDAGHDPNTPLAVYRGEMLSLRIRRIGEAARLRVNTSGTGFTTLDGTPEPTTASPMRQKPRGGVS